MNKIGMFLLVVFLYSSVANADRDSVSQKIGLGHSLTVGDGSVDPVGFHDATPSFSWKLPLGVEKQTAYRIEVTGESLKWDSGWVESDQSVFIPYEGGKLRSRQQLQWRVRFKNEDGLDSGWSKFAKFELGLLSNSDWTAKWIRPAAKAPAKVEKVACLRHQFVVDGSVKQARLYATARGLFEVNLNGKKVGQDHFANGQTSYSNRLDSLTYDVTRDLVEGNNSFDVLLGYGWYAGRFGWQGQRQVFGKFPELLLQLEIVYQDGRKESIVSDEDWTATIDGPILSSSIYDGEHVDATKEWSDWKPVVARSDLGAARIVPKPFATVKETELLSVQEITEPEEGRIVFDLGQNMVGWPRLSIPVEEGKTVKLRFSEMLNSDGTVHTKNYRAAKSTDSYTASKTGTINWEPKFTFHGFRYVELSGLPANAKPAKDWVKGVVLHTEMEKIGTFESSHAKLNQLQSNISWGQRGNFLDIPTDCPQRDERAGWTGDSQAFAPTSMFNFDCHGFWKSWLDSMRDDQLEDGNIPHVIPDIVGRGGSPGWVDAATIVPWEVYLRTGDIEVLSDNYSMMGRLVGWYRNQTVDGLLPNIEGYGDWLQPNSENKRGDTPSPLLGLAFYGNSCRILADSAHLLGRTEDATKYAEEADSINHSFAEHYFDSDGKLQNAPETQTGYLLAIAFDLIPNSMKPKATEHLVRLIGEADGHLRTGFLGTPYIVSVLDQMGHSDLAMTILLKETYPSWFYSINQGATTMWERWNSYSKQDGFSGDRMNSLNHYAYGAVGQWMYERLAGLSPDPDHPGYKHFFVRPLVTNELDWARAELETNYGKAVSAWKRENGRVVMEVVVPPNATATVEFPSERKSESVEAGTYRYFLKM
ncbi:family 78 glycoside hydrolase catalytic domain [Rubripirellula obstinata]|nr:family 78 glycoside hydrolase catalytic domain [Rubripirellula obstinata]